LFSFGWADMGRLTSVGSNRGTRHLKMFDHLKDHRSQSLTQENCK